MYQKVLDGYVNSKTRFKILYIDLRSEEVTFKGKMKKPVHSWFRLTPSYSPYLVKTIIKEMKCNNTHKILDPFVGVGTTLIECKKEGINSIGIEINPILYEVSKGAIEWNLEVNALQKLVNAYLNEIRSMKHKVRDINVKQFPNKLNIDLPKIHNLFRWWNEDVLKDLLIAREVLSKQNVPDKYRHFLKVGLASILTEVANVHRNHPTICFLDNPAYRKRFPDRVHRTVSTIEVLESKLNKMIKDIQEVQQIKNAGEARVILGDSTKLSSILPKTKIDAVITSPSYPNRYSYVMETRPHLYFFEIFNEPREASDLDLKTIGGTWGRATFILKDKVIKPLNNNVEDCTYRIVESIRKESNLLANYEQKYFNDMYIHFKELDRVMSESGKCAYVVGNSRIKGVEVPTDIILGEFLEKFGFDVDKIVRIRSRLGKKDLYEAIVYASRSKQ